MAKAKEAPRGRVTLDHTDLTNKTRVLLYTLNDVVGSPQSVHYGEMMSIKDLSGIVDAIKAECGEDAKISVHMDDYFGNSVNITWYRPETDEEWAKRVKANEKRAKTAAVTRKAAKKQNEIKEREELARLQKKYLKEA